MHRVQFREYAVRWKREAVNRLSVVYEVAGGGSRN